MNIAPAYELYGLRIRSDLPLPGRPVDIAEPDVELRWRDVDRVPESEPPGEPLIRVGTPASGYVLVKGEDRDGYTLRVGGACEFHISPERSRVVASGRSGHGRRIAEVFAAGTVPAVLLGLAGRSVIHASAVEHDGRAIACVGPPGSGKSTLAAVLCSGGARLVTDDVLPIEATGSRAYVARGATLLRLRPWTGAPGGFAASLPFPASETSDGRIGVTPPHAVAPRIALGAIGVIRRDGCGKPPRVVRLAKGEALAELTRHIRPGGWVGRERVTSTFRALAPVVSGVPVFLLEPGDMAMEDFARTFDLLRLLDEGIDAAGA